MKVLITRRIHKEAIDLLRNKGYELTYFDNNRPLEESQLAKHLALHDAVLCCVSEKINKGLLEKGIGRLKVISNMAVGLDNIDVEAVRAKGIIVENTPGVVTESTADMTLAMAFALIRKVRAAHNFILKGEWKDWDPEIFLGRTFSRLIWGIVGYGNIGKAVARRLKGFGMKVVFYDPDILLSDELAVKQSFEDLLAQSDIVSLHLPLNKSTRYIFSKRVFEKMKASAFLINMARGPIVKTEDLLHALKACEIAGAALDVMDPEPVVETHEICKFENVLLAPHIGTATIECRRDMAIMAAENIIKHLN